MTKINILNILLIGVLMVATLSITACSTKTPIVANTSTELSASQNLMKFENVDALKEFMSKNAVASSNSYNYRGGEMMQSFDMVKTTAAAPMAQDSAGAGDNVYSQTNVQVEGVDEADFVKNDNRYIYLISDNQLVIIDGKDGENSEILSKTDIPLKAKYGGSVRDIFLNDDKVIIFVDSYEPEIYFNQYDITPIESSRQNVKVLIYDVSNREDP
ncbi:MAG: beta-propeller domain-containing protein, partial [Candidatus Woesearchaeota archaeon]